MAHVPGGLQFLRGLFRIGYQHADNPEFRAVIGDQGIHIDPGVRQDLRNPVHGTLFVFRENRQLPNHCISS